MTHERLIILGAGATAAISDGALPVGCNFFSSNPTWSSSISDYPHLAAAQRKIEPLKTNFGDKTPVSLTDAWLFLDTVFKYHCATRHNSAYNYELLRIRYDRTSKDMPAYLQADYLNGQYEALSADMRPCFSTLSKRIYDTYDQRDQVAYFLIVAGWELKHLLYKTYHPDLYETLQQRNLYGQLLERLKNPEVAGGLADVAVISFNYDIFFENSCCGKQGVSLELLRDSDGVKNQAAIPFCKPHGGWNIRHLNQRIEEHCSLADFVKDQDFDRLPADEERPAMIPYFSHPDEISKPHQSRYPDVGKFFQKQEKRMQTLLNNARTIASIGYSFSDIHVKNIVQDISLGTTGRGKRLLCVLKGDSDRENIRRLWEFKEENGTTFRYCPCGFNKSSIDEVVNFFNTGKS